jgi:hypothetical protein
VTKSRLRKAVALEKGHQSESSEQISLKCLVNLRSHRMVDSKVTMKSATGLIKVVFGNSLMQRHCYYPHNIDLMHQECNVAESIISMCFDITDFSKDNINARKDLADLVTVLQWSPK